tara:strand:- start:208 stop:930 length:723 start_codon:yes stop_codon:yes gene_type:complete
MKYSIQTTSDYSYFVFLKIFVNSILDKCDLNQLNKIYIIDTGMDSNQLEYLKERSLQIEIITTGLSTNFKGGTWGEDWQKNVKGKTVHLYDTISRIQEPLLMLDADMMITSDLYPLLKLGGDLQVCVRPGNSVKYIGSYFFSLNPSKTLPFIKEWKDLTQNSKGKGAHESPALSKTVEKYKSQLNIIEIEQDIVNRINYPALDKTIIVHFKGTRLSDDINESMHARLIDRGWSKEIEAYV